MMRFFKWFTAGSEAASKVLDGAVKGIDALVYTEEEKAGARERLMQVWLDLQKALGEETTVRSITRRILAVLIIVPFVVLILMAAVAFPFSPEYAKFLSDLAAGNFGLMALGVAAFYFGPYMFSYLKGKNP